jgi:O-antigen/teichoic acid export membrane protein
MYWLLAASVVVLSFALSGWFASRWLNVHTLPKHQVHLALLAAGVALAIRWPVSLYNGVLAGFQLQVRQNVVTIIAALVRFIGGVAIILFVSRTVTAYMMWQVAAALLEVTAMGTIAWRAVGASPFGARFDPTVVRSVWRFMAALNIVSVAALVVSQIDRIVISKRLPLADLGYYSIAVTATGAITMVSAAVSAAVFPRFAAQSALDDDASLLRTYRQAAHAVGFVSVAASLPLAFFARPILSLWVGSRLYSQTPTVLTLLSVAFLLNAMYSVPYTLAIATAHTRIPLVANLIAAPVLAVSMYLIVPGAGLIGAASLVLVLMACFFVAYGVRVHRYVLRGEWTRSVLRIAATYSGLGLVVFGAARILAAAVDRKPATYALLVVAAIVYVAVGSALVPDDLRMPRVRLGALRRWRLGPSLR